MNTVQEIQIILGSCMNNRDKIEAIVALIQSDMEETHIFLTPEKIRQQILSEILYLLEKIEKNKVTTAGYISKRIKNCVKNCAQSGWIVPRRNKELNNIEYLENFSSASAESAEATKQEQPKKTRKRKKGWHKKTELRLERLLTCTSSGKNKRRKKTEYVPLFA